MMNEAYVVGYGMIDALGNNPKDCFSKLLDQNDYISTLPSLEGYLISKGFLVEEQQITELENLPKSLTKTQRMGFHAVSQALAMSKLPPSQNVAVVFSTVLNDIETLEEIYPRLVGDKRAHPRKILNRIPDLLPSYIASYYQFMGHSLSVFAACASGISSIDYAMRLLDEYDYVIVGGSDAGCHNVGIRYFNSLGALADHSCPFDDHRSGFVMGEGAGALVLQSANRVKDYNSTVYAKLYPPGLSNDALDATAPAEDGRGAKLAIEKAIKQVNGSIDVINAHATSTLVGDMIEYQTVTDMFWAKPIYAPKSKIGHTMAAAGILETIYSIESMQQGIIPHVHNLKNCSGDVHQCLTTSNQLFPDQPILRTLNNSFGFGGKCASQVIEVKKN